MTSFLRSLLLDNPIITKDANLILRRPRTWAAWLITVGAFAVIAAMVVDEHDGLYPPLQPAGDALLAIVTAVATLAASLLVPAFASSTIAGEREQGTLPLLVVTGMSPLRIVVGKAAAVIVVATPFVAVALATMGLAPLLRGVELVDVLAAATGVVATTICAASVGVAVSASATRARVAAPTAVLAGIIPAIFCALPSIVVTIEVADNGEPVSVLGVAALVAAVLLSIAALFSAWSALAPRSTPRFARATQVFLLVALGMPLAALTLGSALTSDDFRAALVAPTGLLVLVATQVFGAVVGADKKAPSTWKVVPLVWLTGCAGLALLWLTLRPTGTISDDDIASTIAAALQALASVSLAGLFARRLAVPLAAVVSVVVVIGAMLLQLVAHALGLRFLDALNFGAVETHNVVGCVLVWVAVAALALAGARKR
jgi:ABC-type transport system involved in multi-copper enzyme maturation permease subunit